MARPKSTSRYLNQIKINQLISQGNRLQNSWFFFSKSVKKSVKCGLRVLRARSTRASQARRVCEAREKKPSLPSLALCFQPCLRPFVWLLAHTWIRKNTDCFAVYQGKNEKSHCCLEKGSQSWAPIINSTSWQLMISLMLHLTLTSAAWFEDEQYDTNPRETVLFSRESWCFPPLCLGNIRTRGKTKLTGFPRDLTLSVLLYF